MEEKILKILKNSDDKDKTAKEIFNLFKLFFNWFNKECVPRTTSRNNIYRTYWQMRSTGVLYTEDELFIYWSTRIYK